MGAPILPLQATRFSVFPSEERTKKRAIMPKFMIIKAGNVDAISSNNMPFISPVVITDAESIQSVYFSQS